jgi:hypothetical protein
MISAGAINNEFKSVTCNLDCLLGINDAWVGLDTVPFWRRSLDFEADFPLWRVPERHCRRDGRREGADKGELGRWIDL